MASNTSTLAEAGENTRTRNLWYRHCHARGPWEGNKNLCGAPTHKHACTSSRPGPCQARQGCSGLGHRRRPPLASLARTHCCSRFRSSPGSRARARAPPGPPRGPPVPQSRKWSTMHCSSSAPPSRPAPAHARGTGGHLRGPDAALLIHGDLLRLPARRRVPQQQRHLGARAALVAGRSRRRSRASRYADGHISRTTALRTRCG